MELAIEIVEFLTALAGLAAAVAMLVPEARRRLRQKGKDDQEQYRLAIPNLIGAAR